MPVDMNTLAGTPSSLELYPRVLLVWFYIKFPAKNAMLWERGEKRQKNVSYKITLMGCITVREKNSKIVSSIRTKKNHPLKPIKWKNQTQETKVMPFWLQQAFEFTPFQLEIV